MLDAFLTMDGLIALVTLTAMEVVLGVDNIIFITILIAKLPEAQRELARKLGISLALILRLGLLFSISWIMKLTDPLFSFMEKSISGRDLILLGGGLFLMAKATFEIHDKLEGDDHPPTATGQGANRFASILIQILILDIVFSLDSVITAVGMAQQISIMVVAMVTSVLIMLWSSRSVGEFVMRRPTIKILALSFLILIGFTLVMEGLGAHVAKGYIYFAMAYALLIEMINMRVRGKENKKAKH